MRNLASLRNSGYLLDLTPTSQLVSFQSVFIYPHFHSLRRSQHLSTWVGYGGVIWEYFHLFSPTKTIIWRLLEEKRFKQCKRRFLSLCQLQFRTSWAVIKCYRLGFLKWWIIRILSHREVFWAYRPFTPRKREFCEPMLFFLHQGNISYRATGI